MAKEHLTISNGDLWLLLIIPATQFIPAWFYHIREFKIVVFFQTGKILKTLPVSCLRVFSCFYSYNISYNVIWILNFVINIAPIPTQFRCLWVKGFIHQCIEVFLCDRNCCAFIIVFVVEFIIEVILWNGDASFSIYSEFLVWVICIKVINIYWFHWWIELTEIPSYTFSNLICITITIGEINTVKVQSWCKGAR